MLLAAVCLVPDLASPIFALTLVLLGLFAAVRQVHRRLRYQRLGFPHPWRRDVFPALAYLILRASGGVVWTTGTAPMDALFTASLLIISQATLSAWEMLVDLGTRARASSPDSPY